MSSMLKKGPAVALLLLATFAWGCDTSTEPVQEAPTQLEAVDGTTSNLLGGLIGGVTDILSGGLRLVQTTVAVVGDVGTALIGPVGGILQVDDHSISVPPGAVPNPAEFSMEVLAGRTVEVDLRAVDPETGDDVGGRGFTRPVQLALSYADANVSRRDVDRLVIVRIHDDGTREVLPSVVNKYTRQVTAELDHFSKYGLCRN